MQYNERKNPDQNTNEEGRMTSGQGLEQESL